MVSKPKPGLGKGLARTLTHSATPSTVIHHPIALAPIVSNPAGRPASSLYGSAHHHHTRAAPWPSTSSHSSSHVALLPLWDPPPVGGHGHGDLGRRSYVTLSSPLRAAASVDRVVVGEPTTYSIPQYLPTSLLFDRVRVPFHEFGLPPPPPPPPPPPVTTLVPRVPSPPHTAQHPRPSQAHTVLSPSPQLNNGSSSSSSPTPPLTHLGIRHDTVDIHPSTTLPDPNNLNLYSSNLIFHLGASGYAKEKLGVAPRRRDRGEPPPPRPRSFPLPDVTPPKTLLSTGIGEDAYFARVDSMCVADGVGGWSRSGKGPANAGRWAHLLTHYCEEEVGRWWAGADDYMTFDEDGSGWAARAWKRGEDKKPDRKHRRPLDPVEIMQKGYEKCLACAAAEGIYGSSTCLLALLHHSTLLIANLGDCSLLLIRRGEVVFRTSEMQHAFNFPLQLGTHSRDEPMKDAKRYDIGVEKEDVVIVGSDGLMDNLFDEDILEILSEFAPPSEPSSLPPFSPQLVSEALCNHARAVSEQTTATTPFMMRAIEEGIDFVGGKRDDISVVVGVIGDRDGGNLTIDASGR